MDYKKYLTEDILPFWLKHSIDTRFGGIMTCVDEWGQVTDEKKNIMFVGRALWTYAMAYRLVAPKSEYLHACAQLSRFYTSCELPDGQLPHFTDRQGNCADTKNLVHCQIHAAMGLAQYYRICKDAAVRDKAARYADLATRWYMDSRINLRTNAGSTKNFGMNFLILSMAQFVRNAGIEPEKYDALASIAIREMKRGGFVDDGRKAVLELIGTDGQPLPHPKGTGSCPGHVFEAAWFVLCEAELKNDDRLRDFGRKLCDYAMPEGFEEHCPFIPTARNVQDQPWGEPAENYVWWNQCEGIITYRLAYNIFKDEKYKHLADKLEKDTFAAFADPVNGEWFAEVTRDGTVVNRNKGSMIKGPFHLPRILLALDSLERTGSICRYMS